jgi:hypothetical protein
MNESEQPSNLSTQSASVAVYICSSDSRRDILDRVLPTILSNWPDCPYPIYVGLNTCEHISPRVTPLQAKASGWREECLAQIAQLSESHLIVVLDDFLFQAPVDQSSLSSIVSNAIALRLPYLRLLPLRKSLIQRFMPRTRVSFAPGIEAIDKKRPFYSALQIAVWEKTHLVSLLKLHGSIWDFEHQKKHDTRHYVVSDSPPIAYRHIVEKGRWLPYAKRLLNESGMTTDLGKRRAWPKWTNLRVLTDEMRFLILGYANH